jgi:hypothetical protein
MSEFIGNFEESVQKKKDIKTKQKKVIKKRRSGSLLERATNLTEEEKA